MSCYFYFLKIFYFQLLELAVDKQYRETNKRFQLFCENQIIITTEIHGS